MTLSEKASYVKGLVEGFDLDKDKKENKALLAIVDLLDDMAGSILDLENQMDDAADQVEDMADDLEKVLKNMCKCHDGGNYDSDEDGSDDLFYEVKCPACNTTVCLPESKVMENDINCPNCGQEIEIEIEDSDDDNRHHSDSDGSEKTLGSDD